MKKYLILAAAILAILAGYFIVSNLGSGSSDAQLTEVEVYEVEATDTVVCEAAATVTEVATATKPDICEAVDLGLSVKWATCNLGASRPGGYGYYYAWGETLPKREYTQSNCQTNGQNLHEISGTSRDAAKVNWGEGWRMPTKAEFEELLNRCIWTREKEDGHKGYRVTGPNGNSIFLPAAGCRGGSSSFYVGSSVYYWSSTSIQGSVAWRIYSDISGCGGAWGERYGGCSIRPVSD